MREMIQDADKQLEVAYKNAIAEWQLGDFTDAIPAMRPDVGCSCIATAFGAEYYWGKTESQTPGVKSFVLAPDKNNFDLDNIVEKMEKPDILRSGWLVEGFRRIKMFAEAGDGIIPIALLDAAGGLNVVADLLGMKTMFEAMYEFPEALHKLLGIIQETYIDVIAEGIKAANGEDNISTTDFVDFWFPEGVKGHVSDDISNCISPDMYNIFSGPYHDMIFDVYGEGGLHNCGPNPCANEYVSQRRNPGCIDLANAFSYNDLPGFKKSLGGRAFVYLNWDCGGDPAQWWKNVADICAPELLVVPQFIFTNADDAREAYPGLKKIAQKYAQKLNWYCVLR